MPFWNWGKAKKQEEKKVEEPKMDDLLAKFSLGGSDDCEFKITRNSPAEPKGFQQLDMKKIGKIEFIKTRKRKGDDIGMTIVFHTGSWNGYLGSRTLTLTGHKTMFGGLKNFDCGIHTAWYEDKDKYCIDLKFTKTIQSKDGPYDHEYSFKLTPLFATIDLEDKKNAHLKFREEPKTQIANGKSSWMNILSKMIKWNNRYDERFGTNTSIHTVHAPVAAKPVKAPVKKVLSEKELIKQRMAGLSKVLKGDQLGDKVNVADLGPRAEEKSPDRRRLAANDSMDNVFSMFWILPLLVIFVFWFKRYIVTRKNNDDNEIVQDNVNEDENSLNNIV